jgi:hypothetical protein
MASPLIALGWAATMTYGTTSFALRWREIPIRSTSPIIRGRC